VTPHRYDDALGHDGFPSGCGRRSLSGRASLVGARCGGPGAYVSPKTWRAPRSAAAARPRGCASGDGGVQGGLGTRQTWPWRDTCLR
jgi:hypothetical protein